MNLRNNGEIPMNTKKRPTWFEVLPVIVIPILGMAVGTGVMFFIGFNQTEYGNLIVNTFFLVGIIALAGVYRLSAEDLGLKVIKDQMKMHVTLSLVIFTLYMSFYIFIVGISALKHFSSSILWSLFTYLVVVVAEELYFRGALYSFLEIRFSAKTALIVSSILFGLFHAQQGLRGMISKIFTGWLWGSIRYSTGMIFLLIIPVHFAYNSIWLLFEGNWNNPPAWAIYALPTIEFVLGLAIVLFTKRSASEIKG